MRWFLVGLCVLGWAAHGLAAPVSITTATDLQASITANDPGTVFLLAAGTHRRGSLTPKDGNVFLGAAGAILSGGEILTGWTASGSDWFVTGQTQQGTKANPVNCDTGWESCADPEDVFYDDVPLQGVASQGALGPGKFFFDYAADRIYIRDNPSGHVVETSVRAAAFIGSAQNVTVKNLQIEKYAAPLQKGAFEPSATAHGWTVENCVIRHNHGYAIHTAASGWIIRGNTLTTNGQMGAGGGGTKNLLLENNIVTNNNYTRTKKGFEAGGVKFANARALRYIRNQIADNRGVGLWCDINCVDVLYDGNVVTGHTGAGIVFEISYHAVIRNNVSVDNGTVGSGWGNGAQIELANSERMDIYGNTVHVAAAGGAGITLIQQNRGTGMWGTYRTRFNRVHHNTLRYATGTSFVSGFSGAVDDHLFDIEELGNTWDYNAVFVNVAANVFTFNQCRQSEAPYTAFQACGFDLHGVRYDP